MGAVTNNPVLIALINMTVVFAVLYGLSIVVRLIQVIDPTHKKKIAQSEPIDSVKPVIAAVDTTIQEEDYDEMMILFTAALAAYGHGDVKIVAIRPVSSATWSQTARMESVHVRTRMF